MNTVYDSRIEKLIEAAVSDGVLTDQEKRVLINNANDYGYDLDEFEMYVNAKLFEAQQRLKATAQKTNKVGIVKKCPNCGATVDTAAVKCPECGYNFGGVEANSSSQRLAFLLMQSNKAERSDIVINFPVPSTKADLLEFMVDLMHRSKHYDEVGDYEMSSAFEAKYKECAEKAHVFFETDSDFQPLFEKENELKKFRWNNISNKTKKDVFAKTKHLIGCIIIVPILLWLFAMMFMLII